MCSSEAQLRRHRQAVALVARQQAQVFGPQAQLQRLAGGQAGGCAARGQRQLHVAQLHVLRVQRRHRLQVHLGLPMKPATKALAGRAYSAVGVSTCWMRPSFSTQMRSPMVMASTWSWVTYTTVAGRPAVAQRAVQLGQAHAHAGAQLGVQVGQRLVEQEDLGLLDDGAAHGHALRLAARQLPRVALEQVRPSPAARRPRAHAGRSRPWACRASFRPKARFSYTVMCGYSA
jgi:hypothetical protein